MELSKIFENNQKWIGKNLAEDPNYFTKLSEGQHQKYFLLDVPIVELPLKN